MHHLSSSRHMNVAAPWQRKKRGLFPRSRPRPLPPARLLAVATAFAGTLLFLVLVLLSTSPPPSSAPPRRHDAAVARSSFSSSSSRPPRCAAASLGALGDEMVSMLPADLPFTVFVPSPDSFRRVLRLRVPPNASADAAEGAAAAAAARDTDDDANMRAILSRVLGFSAVPRRLLSADVPPPRLVDSVSGLRIHAARDARGALVVNGVRSECVDLVRGQTVVHVVAGVLMDAEFERSFPGF